MTYSSAQPNDSATIPISSVYSKENNTFLALPSEPGAYQDAFNNQSGAAMTSFIRPIVTQETDTITGAGATLLSCSFVNANIAGNSIVVALGIGAVPASNLVVTIADSNGNTYTQAVASSLQGKFTASIFFATRIAKGTNTVTAALSGSGARGTSIALQIYEVFGLIAPNPLDQISTGSSTSSTSASTTTVLPTIPNELAFMAVATAGTQITPAPLWTPDTGSLFPAGGALVTFSSQSQLVSSVSALTPSATLFPATAWTAALATFKSVTLPLQGVLSPITASNAPIVSINASTSSVQLRGGNAIRKGLNIFNASTSVLYIAFQPTASASLYTTQLPANSLYEMPQPIYTGSISGIWNTANGYALITELS